MEKLRRKLINLTTQRATQIEAAEDALNTNDEAAYNAAMAEVSKLDTQIANVNNLIAAKEATPAAPPAGADPAAGQQEVSDSSAVRSSREYVRAFCNAVRARVSPATANGERFDILRNALTEGTDENGGFLVPVDLQTRINELRRQMVNLRSLCNVEHVTTPTGFRVIDTKPTAGFTLLEEMGTIPQDDQPAFSRIGYTVKDYGLIVPLSNDLLNDNDAGLMEYLARWMAKKAVITENNIILSLLGKLTATVVTAGQEIAAIKKVLNVTLDPSIALNAELLTNQSGYDCLDQLVDTHGRALMQPDITTGTGSQVKGKHITTIGNSSLKNGTDGSPLYIGDFKSYITIFDRQTMEFTTTNIGGDAWRTNSTEGRAIMRLDAQVLDDKAAAALSLAGGLDAAG